VDSGKELLPLGNAHGKGHAVSLGQPGVVLRFSQSRLRDPELSRS
jgi:hypothetical protein